MGDARVGARRLVRGLAMVFTLVALAACGSGHGASDPIVPGTLIDGYAIGDPTDCSGPDCEDVMRIAMEDIGERGLDPTSIVGHAYYEESSPPGTASGGGALRIVVFNVDDGHHAAVGVHCGVGPCQVVSR